MSLKKIPILDYRGDWPGFVKGFGEAFKTIGFAVITNHGIDPKLFEETYGVMRQAFALPPEAKAAYEIPEHTTGHVPFRMERAVGAAVPDEKEFWEVRHRGAYFREAQFPSEVPAFKATTKKLYDALDGLSRRLLDALGEHLSLPAKRLSDMTLEGDSLMRLIHYPPLTGNESGVRSAPHEDINLITLLVSATAPGLQVKNLDGEWLDVANGPEDIIVNAGDMLQALTAHLGNRVPSTTHQVVNLPGERYSIPFFVHPRNEVELRPGLTAGAYLDQRLREIGLKK